MTRPLLSRRGALLGCCMLLFSQSSSPFSPSLADAAATTSTAAASYLPSSSLLSSSSWTARRLGSSSSSSRRSSSRVSLSRGGGGEDEKENDRRSFSVVDAAKPTALLSHPSRLRSRSRRSSSPSPSPTIDVYVRTYSGDAAWLTWLLRSIEENVEAGAFRKLIVSVPRGSGAKLFESFLPSFRLPIVLLIVDDDRFERATAAMKSRTENGGYHAQMFDKLTRPPLFSDADYFVHVDSDCVFKRQPVRVKRGEEKENPLYRKISRFDFVDARGRVRVRRVAFASLPEPFHRWKRAAEGMLLEGVSHETMSCFPLVFPREVYGLVEELVLQRHGSNGEEGGLEGSTSSSALLRVLSQRLHDFGEFTAMGHVLTTRMREGERWVSDSEDGGESGNDGKGGEVSSSTSTSRESFCALAQQAWSWGSVTPEAAVEAERSLRVGW